MKRRKKIRKLAAPFVVTASMAGGEAVAQPLPEAPPGFKVTRQLGGHCLAFPADFKCPPPGEGTCNPPPPMKVACPLPEQRPGTRLDRRAEGVCFEVTEMKCPPDAFCNPPPPRRVKCPPEPKPEKEPVRELVAPDTLPAAPDTGKIYTRADGTCWHHPESNCPEGAKCNPPPPRRVRCR